jgi:hypothetical protein
LDEIVTQMKSQGAPSIRTTPKLLSQIREGRSGASDADRFEGVANVVSKASVQVTGWEKFLATVDPLLPRQLSKKAAQLFQPRISPIRRFGTEL